MGGWKTNSHGNAYPLHGKKYHYHKKPIKYSKNPKVLEKQLLEEKRKTFNAKRSQRKEQLRHLQIQKSDRILRQEFWINSQLRNRKLSPLKAEIIRRRGNSKSQNYRNINFIPSLAKNRGGF